MQIAEQSTTATHWPVVRLRVSQMDLTRHRTPRTDLFRHKLLRTHLLTPQGITDQLAAEPAGSAWLLTGGSRGHCTLWDARFRLPVHAWRHPAGGAELHFYICIQTLLALNDARLRLPMHAWRHLAGGVGNVSFAIALHNGLPLHCTPQRCIASRVQLLLRCNHPKRRYDNQLTSTRVSG